MTKTEQAIYRIAQLKIKAYNLTDTPEEYIKKSAARTEAKTQELREMVERNAR